MLIRFVVGAAILPDNCKCIAAKLQYWSDYPSVQQANIDPVYYYEVFSVNLQSWLQNLLYIDYKQLYKLELQPLC